MTDTFETATSADGTPIAFERSGHGRPVVLIGGAFSDRATAAGLAAVMAPHFTVVVYDRRGRGDSGDSVAYAVEREVEDLHAVIERVGGRAAVVGHSSGAILGLEAARSRGPVERVVAYEPPYIADGRPRPADDLVERLRACSTSAGATTPWHSSRPRRSASPQPVVEGFRQTEMWPGLVAARPHPALRRGDHRARQPAPARPPRRGRGARAGHRRHGRLSLDDGRHTRRRRGHSRGRHLTIEGGDHGTPQAHPELLLPVLLDFLVLSRDGVATATHRPGLAAWSMMGGPQNTGHGRGVTDGSTDPEHDPGCSAHAHRRSCMRARALFAGQPGGDLRGRAPRAAPASPTSPIAPPASRLGCAPRHPRRGPGGHPLLEPPGAPRGLLRRPLPGGGAAHPQPAPLAVPARLRRQSRRRPGGDRRRGPGAAAGRDPAAAHQGGEGDRGGERRHRRARRRRRLRRAARGLGAAARLAGAGRAAGGGHVLHDRHDRRAAGRRLQPPLDMAALVRGCRRLRTQRGRRDRADGPDVPRQRLGAALRA